MARPQKPELVSVRIADGATVYVDGESHSAGDVVQLPAADAKTLLDAGYADDGKARTAREILAAIREASDAELELLLKDKRRSVRVAADNESERRYQASLEDGGPPESDAPLPGEPES